VNVFTPHLPHLEPIHGAIAVTTGNLVALAATVAADSDWKVVAVNGAMTLLGMALTAWLELSKRRSQKFQRELERALQSHKPSRGTRRRKPRAIPPVKPTKPK
jgi:hypothetical protein